MAVINGLCVDVWDGFFTSPYNLIAIAFLGYLPIHCISIRAPASMLFMTGLMAIPSVLFFTATFLELMSVILPLGVILYGLAFFGLSELRLARQTQQPLAPAVKLTSSLSPSLPKKTSKSSLRSLRFSNNDHPSFSDQLPPSSPTFSVPLNSTLAPPSPISKRKRRES